MRADAALRIERAAEELALLSQLDGLEAEMEHLMEVWLDHRAAGTDTAAPEAAWKDADRERRKLERKLRRLNG